ncbi:MAG: exodeoxyribonuclease VII small subunit [Christensenellales bacterium]
MNFEQSMKELENIISKMENPDTSIEESVELYEKGVKLSNNCLNIIKNAEAKIALLKDDGKEEELN